MRRVTLLSHDGPTFFAGPAGLVARSALAGIGWFDFDYVWEVYKPAQQRRWGYYTLPILYGDRLVARFDPKLDRTANTLVINGLWLETSTLAEDTQFTAALMRGLQRFMQFLNTPAIDLSAVKTAKTEVRLARSLRAHFA